MITEFRGQLALVCGRGHSGFKCPYDCLGAVRWLYRDERDVLLADDAPIPTEDES